MSQSTNCCSFKDTRLPVPRDHALSCKNVVEKPACPRYSTGVTAHCVVQFTDGARDLPLHSSVAKQDHPPRKTSNCVYSRELLVREIGEFVKTLFEREILTTNEGCLH